MLLPILAALGLSGMLLFEKQQTLAEMGRVDAASGLITETSALVHELQRERGTSGIYLGSKGGQMADVLRDQQGRTDARLAAFTTTLAGFDAISFGKGLVTGLAVSRQGLARLGEIRTSIGQLTTPAGESFAYYTATIGDLLNTVGQTRSATREPDVAREVSAYLEFMNAKEAAGQERAVGGLGFAAGRFEPNGLRRLLALGVEQETYLEYSPVPPRRNRSDFFAKPLPENP